MTNRGEALSITYKTLAGVLLTFALMTTPARADFTAQVDAQSVAIDDTFDLKLTSTNDNSTVPDLTPLEQNFQLLSMSQSSATTIINGQVSKKRSWIISLLPKSTGQVTIPPLSLGNEHTAPITLEVLSAGQASSQTDHHAQQAITVSATIPEGNHYLFQDIPLTLRIETTKSIRQLGIGFEDIAGIEVQQQGQDYISQTIRNGLPVTTIERQYVLSPQQTGEFEIPPIVVQGEFLGEHGLAGRYGFDNFFNQLDPMFNKSKAFVAKSEPIKLDIKANPNGEDDWFLPAKAVSLTEEWQPKNLNFAEGEFKQGEVVTREITLSALGAKPEQLPKLDIAEVDGLQIYKDSDVTDELMTNQGRVAVRRVTLSIIPEHGGEFTLPEISVNWQNTVTDTSETAVLPSKTISVQGVSSNIESQTQQTTHTDGVNADTPAIDSQQMWSLTKVVIWMLALVVLMILGGVLYRKNKQIAKNNPNLDAEQSHSRLAQDQKIIVEDGSSQAKNQPNYQLQQALDTQDITKIYQALLDYKRVNSHKLTDTKQLKQINNLQQKLENSLFSANTSNKSLDFDYIASEIKSILSNTVDNYTKKEKSNSKLPKLYPS